MTEGCQPIDLDEVELAALMAQARAGDREAFSRLVVACQTPLRISLAWRAPSMDLVEEVLQQTFIAAYRQLSTYREGRVLPWLKAIARHLLDHELRARRRQVELHDDLLEPLLTPIHADEENEERKAEAAAAALRACLANLSPRARLMVERRYGEALPLAVLARQFKQKAGSLAMILMHIRTELRTCLETKGVAP